MTRAARLSSTSLCGLALTLAAGMACGGEPFDYFANSWNVVGLKDYRRGARVTPANEVLLASRQKLTLRFGPNLEPLRRKHVKTCRDGWMPILLIGARDGDVCYHFTLWATPLPTVEDWQKAFAWPTEGENFLVWVAAKATNEGKAQARYAIEARVDGRGDEAALSVSGVLEPGRSSDEKALAVPFAPVEDAKAIQAADHKVWLQRTADTWGGLMAEAARITVPCKKSTEALLAAHVCQLIASDHGELHGGEGFYDEFYIRDAGYQILELEEAGLWDAAAKAVACYLKRQRPDGRFETQRGQLDANGQALWVLWQYWKITGDKPWLASAYPQMAKAVEWVRKARRQAPADSPFAGLLPAAPADGENLWDGKHHIPGYDFWNLRGLLCTADAARALGKPDEAKAIEDEAAAFRAAIDAAHARTGLPHFPPSWEKAGTHWGNTETLWPTELFPRDDPRVAALIRHVREDFGGGFAEGTIRWMGRADVIHPYMSSYTSMASLIRGDHEAFVEDYFWYLLHTTATHAFPEGIYFKRRYAWSETIPHVTGASNFAFLLRHMLVHESGQELHLLLGVPDGWLASGQTIRVERAPTHFGTMSLAVRGEAKGVRVELERPTRQAPKRIALHLPKSRPLLNKLDGVEVVARSEQKKRWDFPTVVKLYEATRWRPKPLPALVEFPLGKPLERGQCVLLDLKPHAVTDPLAAPFGVPQAKGSRLLFTGLPLGDQIAAGVPFHIIDPAENEGRSFVVLHSPRAPKTVKWPTEVTIPVKQKGRRLFFLGNVTGWESHDGGKGEWGAVAEYVIQYADGTKQVVPLVSDSTADDWVLAPTATDAHCGLRAASWHLNVIGVDLKGVAVEKITFRDLGTPAAPVLVAATLER